MNDPWANVVSCVGWAAAPIAFFYGAFKAYELLSEYEPRRAASPPIGHSVERLVADLGRLSREQVLIREMDPPAKALRLRSITLAYDDTLMAACATLGLPQPSRPPLDDAVRLETELALTGLGLVW